MKTFTVELPDTLANASRQLVKDGYFRSTPEMLIAAAADFIRRNRMALSDTFAREDIAWAKKEAIRAR